MDEPRVRFWLSQLFLAMTVFAALLTAAVSCRTIYETDGDVDTFIRPIILGLLLLIPLVCIWSRRLRLPAIIAILAICGLFTFRQVHLMRRLHGLQTEVAEIIKYADASKAEHGSYPPDLSRYRYRSPDLRTYVKYTVYDPAQLVSSTSAQSPSMPSRPYYEIWFSPTDGPPHGYWYHSIDGYLYDDD